MFHNIYIYICFGFYFFSSFFVESSDPPSHDRRTRRYWDVQSSAVLFSSLSLCLPLSMHRSHKVAGFSSFIGLIAFSFRLTPRWRWFMRRQTYMYRLVVCKRKPQKNCRHSWPSSARHGFFATPFIDWVINIRSLNCVQSGSRSISEPTGS